VVAPEYPVNGAHSASRAFSFAASTAYSRALRLSASEPPPSCRPRDGKRRLLLRAALSSTRDRESLNTTASSSASRISARSSLLSRPLDPAAVVSRMCEPLLLHVNSVAEPWARVRAPPTQDDDQQQRDSDNEPSTHKTSLRPVTGRVSDRWVIWGSNRPIRIRNLVEAAGVEPASEAASSGISTSVSRILVLAWRLLPTGSASASRGACPTSKPRRPRGGDPVYVTPLLHPPD
jgi:hypothetical protein